MSSNKIHIKWFISTEIKNVLTTTKYTTQYVTCLRLVFSNKIPTPTILCDSITKNMVVLEKDSFSGYLSNHKICLIEAKKMPQSKSIIFWFIEIIIAIEGGFAIWEKFT